jgi:Zn finger protein HypA/HybF involved in hydrogenase expression
MATELKCPKCGSKSEGKFCRNSKGEGKFCCNCGSPLSLSQEPLEQESLEVPQESSWLDKCPVCKSGKLSISSNKKLLA